MKPINVLFIMATVLMFLSACESRGQRTNPARPDYVWTSATAYGN